MLLVMAQLLVLYVISIGLAPSLIPYCVSDVPQSDRPLARLRYLGYGMSKPVSDHGRAGRLTTSTLCSANSGYQVVAFTATQIPDIEGRLYPPEYRAALPEGIPIYPEDDLAVLSRAGH